MKTIKIGENEFKDLVEDFCSTYVSEYLANFKIDFHSSHDDDEWDFSADITCDDPAHDDWIIHVRMSEYHDGEIAIDIGDCGEVRADDGGLYSFLWNEASCRLSALKYEKEKQEKYHKKDFEELAALREKLSTLQGHYDQQASVETEQIEIIRKMQAENAALRETVGKLARLAIWGEIINNIDPRLKMTEEEVGACIEYGHMLLDPAVQAEIEKARK